MILASQSPRRRQLLALLGIPFETMSPNVDEKIITQTLLKQFPSPLEAAPHLVESLAIAKAQAFPSEDIILAADTLVVTPEAILGKPSDAEEALTMLRSLCGRVHYVYTGVALRKGSYIRHFHHRSKVWFYALSHFQDRLLQEYVASGAPMDKAGAYGIQDRGSLLIEKIEGDYFSIMGLPIARIARELPTFLSSNP